MCQELLFKFRYIHPIMRLLSIWVLLIGLPALGQTPLPANLLELDAQKFNGFVLDEVNQLRKKKREAPLEIEELLRLPAEDHANYMAYHSKLTHFQKSKEKRSPKNRTDFYGGHFHTVGENVQLAYLQLSSDKKINTYEELADQIVTVWRKSAPHYANIINSNYSTTYTALHYNDKGEIYACQLFGSNPYAHPDKDSALTYDYKPENLKRCRRAFRKEPTGYLMVRPDSTVVFVGYKTRFSRKGTHYFNPWGDGFAADIVLKEQYDCNLPEVGFNAKSGVRGIPLDPVMKKNFRTDQNSFFWRFVYVELGSIPTWIDQDYEVNLTIINNKRTCQNILYEHMPTWFEVDLNVGLYLDSIASYYRVIHQDTSTHKIYYPKGISFIPDSLLEPINVMMKDHLTEIKSIDIEGYASIEGSTEDNQTLYMERAQVIAERLAGFGIDSANINFTTLENFKDFRRDIEGTTYSYLLKMTDAEIKAAVNNGLSEELEPTLANHRYAELTIYTERIELIQYDREKLYSELPHAISKNSMAECKKLQSIEYQLALQGEISVNDILALEFPYHKKYQDLLHDRYLMIYRLDTLNEHAKDIFTDSLTSILTLNPKNQKINTTLALLEYRDLIYTSSPAQLRKYVKNDLSKKIFVDPVIMARMRLNIAARHDWLWFIQKKGRIPNKKYMYNKVQTYIKKADLNPNEYCELARYYTFFNEYQFAYKLMYRNVYKTTLRDDRVFFLKLIEYTDLNISDKVRIRHFKRMSKHIGQEFCTYFNSPDLNFQILDDPEIREIYCETCNY